MTTKLSSRRAATARGRSDPLRSGGTIRRNRSADPWVGQILTAGIALAVVSVVLFGAGHLVWGFVFGAGDDFGFLKAGSEAKAITWASTLATGIAATALALLAVVSLDNRIRLIALSAICYFFSLDDAVVIHERIGAVADSPPVDLPEWIAHRLWIVFWIPLIVIAFYLFVDLAQQAEVRIRRFVWLGLGMLGSAVILLELGSAALSSTRGSDNSRWQNVVTVGLEETAELAGWILIAAALLALLVRRVFQETHVAPMASTIEEDSRLPLLTDADTEKPRASA